MKVFADVFYWLIIVPPLFLLFLRVVSWMCIALCQISVMIHTIWKNFFFSNIVNYADYLSSFEAGLHLENKCCYGTPLQYSCLENPMDEGAWWTAVHGVAKSRIWLSDFTLTFHFHALEKEMATHSSVLGWRIPGTGEPGGLPSMGSHRVGHDWSDLGAAVMLYYPSHTLLNSIC